MYTYICLSVCLSTLSDWHLCILKRKIFLIFKFKIFVFFLISNFCTCFWSLWFVASFSLLCQVEGWIRARGGNEMVPKVRQCLFNPAGSFWFLCQHSPSRLCKSARVITRWFGDLDHVSVVLISIPVVSKTPHCFFSEPKEELTYTFVEDLVGELLSLIGPPHICCVKLLRFIYILFASILGKGLLTLMGEKWTQHRRMVTPGFHYDILKSYIKLTSECAHIMLVCVCFSEFEAQLYSWCVCDVSNEQCCLT